MYNIIPTAIRKRLTFNKKGDSVNAPVKHIDFAPTPCEDCGKRIGQRRIIWNWYTKHNQQSWIGHCQNCKNYLNPDTGEFDIENKNTLYNILKRIGRDNLDDK